MKMGSKVTSGVIRSVDMPVLLTDRNSVGVGHGHDSVSERSVRESSSICSCCCEAAASKDEERNITAFTTHCAV